MSGEVVTCLKRHSESSLEPDGSLGAAGTMMGRRIFVPSLEICWTKMST